MKSLFVTVLALGALNMAGTTIASACDCEKGDHSACGEGAKDCKCKSCGCEHKDGKSCSETKGSSKKK